MTHKYIVLSRTIVQFITSLEKDTDKITEISNEFDTDMSRCFKEEEDLTYEKSKPNPEGWSEYRKYDPEFYGEFDNIIMNSNVLDSDADFTPYVFKDTYLNM